MKSFESLNKDIDKYYEGSLDDATSDQLELKATLDKMNVVNDIENNISVSIDIGSVVEKGQEIRFNIKLRKATWKFLTFSTILSLLIGFMYMKVSISLVIASQFIVLILLLIINTFLLKKNARGMEQ